MVEDIRNRIIHPLVQVSSIVVAHLRLPRDAGEIRGQADAKLRITLRNVGNTNAVHTCVRLECDLGGQGHPFFHEHDPSIVNRRTAPTTNAAYFEVLAPVYPNMEVVFGTELHFRLEFHAPVPGAGRGLQMAIGDSIAMVRDGAIRWTTFADSAPPQEGTVTFCELDVEGQAMSRLRKMST
jgi:hypothetical protein